MGRFYKTAKPELLDFMYQVPEQAILGAIKGADTQLQQQEQYLTDFQKQLKQQALDPDVEKQRQKLKEYEDLIKQRSLKISSSPLEALKEKQAIRELGTTIYEDVTRGELAAQYGNYLARQKHYEEELKRATGANGEIREEDLRQAMAAWDAQFAAEVKDTQGNITKAAGTSYDPKTGKYNKYGSEKLVDFYDSVEKAQAFAKDWKPDVNTDTTIEGISGDFYVTERNSNRTLKIDDLTRGVYRTMMNDPKLRAYYDQKIRILSGGDDAKRIGLSQQIYGSRENPLDPRSPLKMVQAVDEKGQPEFIEEKNPTTGKMEKKPKMVVESFGELYSIAWDAANKNKINDVTYSRTLEKTEEAKSRIAIAEDEAKALAKKRIDEGSGFTTNTDAINVVTIDGETKEEVSNKIKTKEASLLKLKEEQVNAYGKAINANPNIKNKQATIKQVKAFIDNSDWNGLQNFIKGNKIVGIENVGTDVKELSNQIATIEANITNEKVLLNAIERNVLSKTPKGSNETYSQKRNRLIKEYDEALAIGDTYKTLSLASQIGALNNEIDAATNQQIQSSNKNSRSLTITDGDAFRPFIGDKAANDLQNDLSKVTEDVASYILGGGAEAIFVDAKGNSQKVNFDELLQKGIINYEDVYSLADPLKKIYKYADTGKPKTFNLTRAGVVQSNMKSIPIKVKDKKTNQEVTVLEDVGANALGLNGILNDPETKKPTAGTFYIRKSKFNSSNYDAAVTKVAPLNNAKNFLDDAITTLQPAYTNGVNPAELYYTSPEGVKVFPFLSSEKGQGQWHFPDGQKLMGQAGVSYFAEKYSK